MEKKLKRSKSRYTQNPSWNEENRTVCIAINGADGSSSYDYKVHFDLEEVQILVETIIENSSADTNAQALSKGFFSYLKASLESEPAEKP